MKNLFFLLFNFHFIYNNFITNENICELMKTNGSFTGVRTSNKWVKTGKEYKPKYYLYSKGKEWEFDLKLWPKEIEITFKENTIKDIDSKIIHSFGVLLKGNEYFECNISNEVMIFYRKLFTFI